MDRTTEQENTSTTVNNATSKFVTNSNEEMICVHGSQSESYSDEDLPRTDSPESRDSSTSEDMEVFITASKPDTSPESESLDTHEERCAPKIRAFVRKANKNLDQENNVNGVDQSASISDNLEYSQNRFAYEKNLHQANHLPSECSDLKVERGVAKDGVNWKNFKLLQSPYQQDNQTQKHSCGKVYNAFNNEIDKLINFTVLLNDLDIEYRQPKFVPLEKLVYGDESNEKDADSQKVKESDIPDTSGIPNEKNADCQKVNESDVQDPSGMPHKSHNLPKSDSGNTESITDGDVFGHSKYKTLHNITEADYSSNKATFIKFKNEPPEESSIESKNIKEKKQVKFENTYQNKSEDGQECGVSRNQGKLKDLPAHSLSENGQDDGFQPPEKPTEIKSNPPNKNQLSLYAYRVELKKSLDPEYDTSKMFSKENRIGNLIQVRCKQLAAKICRICGMPCQQFASLGLDTTIKLMALNLPVVIVDGDRILVGLCLHCEVELQVCSKFLVTYLNNREGCEGDLNKQERCFICHSSPLGELRALDKTAKNKLTLIFEAFPCEVREFYGVKRYVCLACLSNLRLLEKLNIRISNTNKVFMHAYQGLYDTETCTMYDQGTFGVMPAAPFNSPVLMHRESPEKLLEKISAIDLSNLVSTDIDDAEAPEVQEFSAGTVRFKDNAKAATHEKAENPGRCRRSLRPVAKRVRRLIVNCSCVRTEEQREKVVMEFENEPQAPSDDVQKEQNLPIAKVSEKVQEKLKFPQEAHPLISPNVGSSGNKY